MNRFLRSVRVVSVSRELINDKYHSFWSFVVEYLMQNKTEPSQAPRAGNQRVDYKDTLTPEAFALFAKLRDWRKEAAAREAVPVYTIFTNAQLAEMAEKKVNSLADLKKIDGVGDARMDKYGHEVIGILTESAHERPTGEGEA